MAQKSIVIERLECEMSLRRTLTELTRRRFDKTLRMEHNDVDFGITQNVETFSTRSTTVASYQVIGENGDKEIVVYVTTGAEAHYGLYDEPSGNCLPIDTRELVSTWADEKPVTQRKQLALLRAELDKLLYRNNPAQNIRSAS